MSILSILRMGEFVEEILFSCWGDSFQRTMIKITEAGGTLTLVLPEGVGPLARWKRGRSPPVFVSTLDRQSDGRTICCPR